MTLIDCAIRLATNNCPTLNNIPPVALIPIKLTLLGPSFRTANMLKKLKYDPAKLYKNVESVPPSKVDNNNLIVTTLKLSFEDSVKIATNVIIFDNPNLAPGANAKRFGMSRSNMAITVACAANNAIYTDFCVLVTLITHLSL